MPVGYPADNNEGNTMSDAVKAALRTAIIAFVAAFSVSALDFLNKVSEWFKASGHQPFPDVSVLGYAAGSAALAAFIGLVNWVVIVAQNKFQIGKTPTYTP